MAFHLNYVFTTLPILKCRSAAAYLSRPLTSADIFRAGLWQITVISLLRLGEEIIVFFSGDRYMSGLEIWTLNEGKREVGLSLSLGSDDVISVNVFCVPHWANRQRSKTFDIAVSVKRHTCFFLCLLKAKCFIELFCYINNTFILWYIWNWNCLQPSSPYYHTTPANPLYCNTFIHRPSLGPHYRSIHKEYKSFSSLSFNCSSSSIPCGFSWTLSILAPTALSLLHNFKVSPRLSQSYFKAFTSLVRSCFREVYTWGQCWRRHNDNDNRDLLGCVCALSSMAHNVLPESVG